jgi:hypothetical protein
MGRGECQDVLTQFNLPALLATGSSPSPVRDGQMRPLIPLMHAFAKLKLILELSARHLRRKKGRNVEASLWRLRQFLRDGGEAILKLRPPSSSRRFPVFIFY